jgi:cytochrome P450
MTAAADVDLVSPAAVRDPHAVFEALRAAGPLHWLPRHNAWLLTDYELVRNAMQDEVFSTDTITPLYQRLSVSQRQQYGAAEELLRGWMIFNDPPVHTALRRPVASAFTPKGVAALRDEIEELTDEILDEFEKGDNPDFISSVALPLPAAVIGLLLGVPKERYGDMRRWSKHLGALVMGKVSRRDAWSRALAAAEEMQTCFSDLIGQNGRNPGDNLVTRMIVAADAEGSLTRSQLVGACSLLLFGGHETTMSLIATGVRHFVANPDDRARLLADPLVTEAAVEELLRYDGPAKILVRRVRQDCEWRGHPFRAGKAVYCATMAANRDPEQFSEPDRFIIDRSPNRHVAFGFGLHFCLGAQLARLETQVVLPRVLERFPTLRLACEPDELSWHPTIVGRTLRSLPMRFD